MNATTPLPVLVTGATGFIGRRLARRLIERHSRVCCLVRASSRVDELKSIDVELIAGDVTDRRSVERALAQSQAGTVYHLAGLVRALRRGGFARVNTGGVENVAAACAGRAAPPVLIVVSSLAAAGPSAADRPHVENDNPAPVSHYGRSKLAGEQAGARYAHAVPITLVRPPLVFGPGDRAMLEMFRPIARRGLHFVPGPRGISRRVSLIHVDDLVEGLLLAAERGDRLPVHPSPQGQGIYFLADEECPTYVELGQAMAIALGNKPPRIIHVPPAMMRLVGVIGDMTSTLRRHPGWINRDKVTEGLAGSWTCSSAKARRQLRWGVACGLADRLRETAQWYRGADWL